MTVTVGQTVIVLMAVTQLALAAAVLLLVRERRAARAATPRAADPRALAPAAQRWLLADGSIDDVVRMLGALPPSDALRVLETIHLRARGDQRAGLRVALRGAPWVSRFLAQSNASAWWRRRDAARMLALVGSERDRVLLQQLLDDAHPVVQAGAAASVPHMADRGVIEYVLDGLPDRCMAVRLYQFTALEAAPKHTLPALVARLTADAAPRALKTWIMFAELAGSAELLEQVSTLHSHPDPLIRLSVARALKRSPHPDTEELLLISLRDPDWRVRAVGARSLGALGRTSAVPRLASGLRDVRWRVRFRCALALAQLGEPGQAALREAQRDTDRYAAEMATMIAALPPDGVAELAEI